MRAKVDLIGKRFGRLVVDCEVEKKRSGRYYECVCDCGKTKTVSINSLRHGATKSCGCLRKDLLTKHGMNKSSEYRAWQQMKDRCLNSKNHAFKYYGLRGISLDQAWADSFVSFLKDMGQKPSKKHTLERIDNNIGYSKQNCKWATMQEQSLNKRSKKRDLPRGVYMSLTQGKFLARSFRGKKATHLGTFETIEMAKQAFDEFQKIITII